MGKLGTGSASTDPGAPEQLTPQDDGTVSIAWFEPASDAAVAALTAADPDLEDGFTRSEWLWVRLANGDLILGFFPQDEGYFAHESERGV